MLNPRNMFPEGTPSRRVVDYATQEFFSKGVKQVTMDDIAKGLQMSKRTLYQLFADKEQLIIACIEVIAEREHELVLSLIGQNHNVLEIILRVIEHRVKTLGKVSIEYITEVKRYDAVKEYTKMAQEESIERGEYIYKKGIEQGLFRDDVNIQWLADDDPANLARAAKASDPGLNDGIGVPMWKNGKEPADYHGWKSEEKTAMLEWNAPVRLAEVRLAFDTGLKTRRVALPMPAELVRDYTLEVCVDGDWRQVAQVRDNGLRHRIHAFPTVMASAARVTVERTWGDAFSRILEIRAYGDAIPVVSSRRGLVWRSPR